MEWMAWTSITAIFFIALALMITGMTVWQVIQPTVPRRGLLPLETTRGDRFFIGIVGGCYIHLAWIGLTDLSLWFALGLAVLFMIFMLRWG